MNVDILCGIFTDLGTVKLYFRIPQKAGTTLGISFGLLLPSTYRIVN